MKREKIDLSSASYTPVKLLNAVALAIGARNDNHLALMLDWDVGQLSRIRHRHESVNPRLFVDIMDRTGWPLAKVRELVGIPFGGALVMQVQRDALPQYGQTTPEEVLAIRSKLAAGHTNAEVAREFGKHRCTISEIKRRRTWKNL